MRVLFYRFFCFENRVKAHILKCLGHIIYFAQLLRLMGKINRPTQGDKHL